MTGGIGYPIRERGRGEGGNGKVSFLLRKNGSLEVGALLCVHSAGKQVVIAADADAEMLMHQPKERGKLS